MQDAAAAAAPCEVLTLHFSLSDVGFNAMQCGRHFHPGIELEALRLCRFVFANGAKKEAGKLCVDNVCVLTTEGDLLQNYGVSIAYARQLSSGEEQRRKVISARREQYLKVILEANEELLRLAELKPQEDSPEYGAIRALGYAMHNMPLLLTERERFDFAYLDEFAENEIYSTRFRVFLRQAIVEARELDVVKKK